MVKQINEIKELEEVECDEISGTYTINDKLSNMTASQMSKQSCRPDRRRL